MAGDFDANAVLHSYQGEVTSLHQQLAELHKELAAVGLDSYCSVKALIRHHKNNEAATVGADMDTLTMQLAEKEADYKTACSCFQVARELAGEYEKKLEFARQRIEKLEALLKATPGACAHHMKHGDMDGKTCLLNKCPIHYPEGGQG